MGDKLSQLDADQVIRRSGATLDDPTAALPDTGLAVINVGGKLVPEKYDQIDLTYVAAGNGTGEIETAIYKLNNQTIATLTISYDAQNRITSVIRS